MTCNKCGAQCEENQAFCLVCGNPMQLTADFNLIEKELASNIDELMSELENESQGEVIDEEDDILKTVDVPIEEINMGLKMVDIKRPQMDASVDDLLNDDDDEISPVYIPSERREKNKKKKSSKKKLYAIIAMVAVVVIAIVAGILILFGDKDGDVKKKTFNDYYTEAEGYYNSGDIDKALEAALKAVEFDTNDEGEIKARKLVHNIYTAQKYFGEFYLKNIDELIALGDTSEDYYSAIFSKYVDDQNTEMLRQLMATLGEEKSKEYLGENFVELPVADMASGEYNNYMTVKLSASEGCKIYYVVNGDISKDATEYGAPCEIVGVGEYKLQAYAVNEAGIPSMTTEYTYNVVEGESAAPTVTPSAGTYVEHTQITIVIPEGGKAYYTYDGTTPSTSSTEYTEPVEMLKGSNTFKAIVVDKYGIASEVTSVHYNLKLARNETISSAEDKVLEYYVETGKADSSGVLTDGSILEIAYEDAVEMENDEYYIFTVATTSADGTTTTGSSYIAVNTFDGTVIEGIIVVNGEYVMPQTEDAE